MDWLVDLRGEWKLMGRLNARVVDCSSAGDGNVEGLTWYECELRLIILVKNGDRKG